MIKVVYSFILFLCAWPIIGAHALSCRSPYAQSEDECKALRSWESRNFTPVEELDAQNTFQIIFHSLSGFRWDIDAPRSGSMAEAILKDPSLISINPKISASLISNKKPKTFVGKVGLILEVNPENVVGTSPSDAYSPRLSNDDDAQLSLEMFSAEKHMDIKTPKEILSKTEEYNEIVLTGVDPGTHLEVRATGLIIRCSTTNMTRLDKLSSSNFEKFIKNRCVKLAPSVIQTLSNLRSKYPIFGFPLE